MKFPIGIQDFKSIRNDGFVYVDKTALLYKMANEGKTYTMAPNRPITDGGVSFADSRLERNLNTFVAPALIRVNSGQGHNTL